MAELLLSSRDVQKGVTVNINQLLASEFGSKCRENNVKRIQVLGAPGAGKSYVAKRLGQLLDLPVYHLDQKFWKEDWSPISDDEFRSYCKEICSSEKFIMDGNYGTTFDIRWPAADLVIFVDTNPWICIARQIMRVIKDRLGLLKRDDRPQGVKERFDNRLFWFTIKFREAHGHLIDCKMREIYPQTPYIRV